MKRIVDRKIPIIKTSIIRKSKRTTKIDDMGMISREK
jgi:hypothetical protein